MIIIFQHVFFVYFTKFCLFSKIIFLYESPSPLKHEILQNDVEIDNSQIYFTEPSKK